MPFCVKLLETVLEAHNTKVLHFLHQPTVMRLSFQTCSFLSSQEKGINAQQYVWLLECVSVNSYKWVLTEQDALCHQVSQCHQFTSLWALSSPSRLLSTQIAQTKLAQTNPHIHHMRTPLCTRMHVHTYQPGLLSGRFVAHDWLSCPRTCANNFLSPGDKGEGKETKKKACGRWWWRSQFFIYMEHLF